MNSLDEKRRERAHNGSRRKRDIDAAKLEQPDWNAFIAEHFPDEIYSHVLAVTQKLWMRKPLRDRALSSAGEVEDALRQRGWLREQVEAEPCL